MSYRDIDSSPIYATLKIFGNAFPGTCVGVLGS